METLLLYLIKSSALMALFFCGYHFLLRRETFFNGNRWYLLSGLFISAALPLFFIRKIVWVRAQSFGPEQIPAVTQTVVKDQMVSASAVEPVQWGSIILFFYLVVCGVLTAKVIANVISLFRLLHKQHVVRNGGFALVDLDKQVAPFSFFNYIVYNSSLYSEAELHSILNHEKVHSSQKHSIDVLITKLFSILFWFNPIVWLYKKAIIQNLEFIADRKAVRETQDKRVYQFALLRAVTQPNCLSITNNFNQSLIKKRIVMLNKNQSKKRNLWKYALILPLLVGFMLYFQVKLIAQQRPATATVSTPSGKSRFEFSIDKNTTDAELKNQTEKLKKSYGATLKISKVKRNSNGEIVAIKVKYKDAGCNIEKYVNGDDPIETIYFSKNDDFTGFHNGKDERVVQIGNGSEDNEGENTFAFAFNDDEAPEAPEPPEAPEEIEIPEVPELPMLNDLITDANGETVVVKSVNKNGHTVVTVNGKVVSDVDVNKIIADMGPIVVDGETIYPGGDNGKGKKTIVISTKEIKNQARRAMKQAKVQMEKAQIQKESSEDMQESFQQMKAEQLAQLEKMKAEMAAMKAELEKTKAEFKKQK
ncbi:M56 family metallopeptidase [Flavobacterium sp.]|uniref:M56 family metallopeptidase n=1 Tax=Flavobacterium sp. TaxID=239 RepID=UPI0026067EB2|nr:M56 family metallopeptidase [Flavobacterium sp.]